VKIVNGGNFPCTSSVVPRVANEHCTLNSSTNASVGSVSFPRLSCRAVPVDRTVHTHQGDSAHVADDSVIFDRLIRHRSVLPSGRNQLIGSQPLSVFFAKLTSLAKPGTAKPAGSDENRSRAPRPHSVTVTWPDARSLCRSGMLLNGIRSYRFACRRERRPA
jgi:hypothetical protein